MLLFCYDCPIVYIKPYIALKNFRKILRIRWGTLPYHVPITFLISYINDIIFVVMEIHFQFYGIFGEMKW